MTAFTMQTKTASRMINNIGVVSFGVADSEVSLGSTDGPVTVTTALEIANLSTDQLIGDVISEITNMSIDISMNLAENSLANLAYASNLPSTRISSAASSTVLQIIPDGTSYVGSLLLHTKSALDTTLERVYSFPRVVAAGSSGVAYVKTGIAFIPVSFHVLINASTGTFGEITDDAK